ncbi:protein HGV2 [Impatiens glandulifera]|uniref:protein HGV2 n=1 Tax=Impatiens glandulifera TaxID=253017 RepID=UPI001FB0AF0D|nr:protein HGV2 [Impatiens glandulifera]
MANEVQDNSMAAPQVKELQPSTGGEANGSTVHGTAQTSSIGNVAETSTAVSDANEENTLADAEKFMEKGSVAAKEGDFGEASECYSRALEIRVAHFGELAPECLNAYYKYGCALLYKAQEESDPLGSVPKKEEGSHLVSKEEASTKTNNGESSKNGASSNVEDVESSVTEECATDDKGLEEKVEGGDDESDIDDAAEADEDESDLDLAWKMLDVARVISEKQPGHSMEKVDILSALAETALEREDVETSLRDYLNALSILENLVEPNSRHLAELNFRICLCLEMASKPEEAIPYCEKAISMCKSRVQSLANELKASTAAEPEQSIQLSDKEAEIDTLNALSIELEKKLEDLQQFVANPKSILQDLLLIISGKSKEAEKNATALMSSSEVGAVEGNAKLESSSVFTASKNGAAAAAAVTDLGKVGRSVKRVNLSPVSTESHPAKKQAVETKTEEGKDS